MTGPLAILGPGTLGISAAQWAAECGLETRLLGRDQHHAEAGLRRIHTRWDRAVERERLSSEARTMAVRRLSAAAFGPEALQGAATFLEALPENIEVKHPVLAAAGEWGPKDVLLLSGTSALPITELARRSGLVGRLVGFHLFVPVPRMAVVEMAVAPGTLPKCVEQARDLGKALGKRVVQVRDQPGFAAARMALAQGLEAMRLVEAGVASAEDLDALMTLGYGHPVGPLELSDRVGLDLRLRIAEGLTAAGEARFQPPALLRALVDAGHTGITAQKGFHHWNKEGRRTS
ncbi:3-hydroxyacyl-CoA dehydrogenase family protein [Geothrix sp. PMB-07]|uniref:3-hydroxyacyl-CoA dehydrogenase family protein n=1 Tax=Geothrix sp. PMB-07 TaxID=3068640 RepID=UPI002742946A|nr:3-hydroxyacyl-CoA dehydrogenase family protein [Geothrix sp. PMB-07]WLT33151.1 3-hydroxyacyl-CoA dehydrogenase family protein [Geothrix sp. PMB-07]